MEQMNIFDFIENDYNPSYSIVNYQVKLITCETAKEYIIKNHYSHGCHNAPQCNK